MVDDYVVGEADFCEKEDTLHDSEMIYLKNHEKLSIF